MTTLETLKAAIGRPWTWYGLVILGMLICHAFKLKEGTSFMAGWSAAYFIWEIYTPASKIETPEGDK